MKGCRFQYDDGDFRRGCNCECHQKRSDVQAMHGVMPHPECQHCDREIPRTAPAAAPIRLSLPKNPAPTASGASSWTAGESTTCRPQGTTGGW